MFRAWARESFNRPEDVIDGVFSTNADSSSAISSLEASKNDQSVAVGKAKAQKGAAIDENENEDSDK